LIIDIAERKGDDFRCVLRSADRLSESAICLGVRVKTPSSSSSAWLCSVTSCDQRRGWGALRAREDAVCRLALGAADFRVRPPAGLAWVFAAMP
jgi:hypothetical protein